MNCLSLNNRALDYMVYYKDYFFVASHYVVIVYWCLLIIMSRVMGALWLGFHKINFHKISPNQQILKI